MDILWRMGKGGKRIVREKPGRVEGRMRMLSCYSKTEGQARYLAGWMDGWMDG